MAKQSFRRSSVATSALFLVAFAIMLKVDGISGVTTLLLMFGVQLLTIVLVSATSPVWSSAPMLIILLVGFGILELLPRSTIGALWPITGLILFILWPNFAREFGLARFRRFVGRLDGGGSRLFAHVAYYGPGIVLASFFALAYGIVLPTYQEVPLERASASFALGIVIGIAFAFIGGTYRLWLGLFGAIFAAPILANYGYETVSIICASWLATYVVACLKGDPSTTHTGYDTGITARAKDKSIPAYFDSEAEAEQFRQSVPALELSTVTVSITEPRRVNPNTPKSSLVKVSYQFATDTETVVFSASDIDDAADAIADPESLVVCGDGPFLSSSGFPDSHAEELREKYNIPESHLALTSDDGNRIIATLTPTDRHRLGQWLEQITTTNT